MISRRHYVVLAAALVKTRPVEGSIKYAQWRRDRTAIAGALWSLNKAFDIERFTEATEQ